MRDAFGWGSGASFLHGMLCMDVVLGDEESPHVTVPGPPRQIVQEGPVSRETGF